MSDRVTEKFEISRATMFPPLPPRGGTLTAPVQLIDCGAHLPKAQTINTSLSL
jgi:hypothetical protein